MYYAIVFLPLLGAVIAALIALAGARARYPGGAPDMGDENHAHGAVDESRPHGAPDPQRPHPAFESSTTEPQPAEPPAEGSRSAQHVTTAYQFAAVLLSWPAFADVGFGQP